MAGLGPQLGSRCPYRRKTLVTGVRSFGADPARGHPAASIAGDPVQILIPWFAFAPAVMKRVMRGGSRLSMPCPLRSVLNRKSGFVPPRLSPAPFGAKTNQRENPT